MADIDGKWAVDVATLAGARRYDLALTTAGSMLTGSAVGSTGVVPIRDGKATEDRAEFVLDLVAPIPMSLLFEVQVIGNRLVGTARSGPFPPSNVLGTRMT